MAIDTKLIAQEIDRWLFELNEYEDAKRQRQHSERSEAQANPEENSSRHRKVRINPRSIQRLL